jgi:hypothetical protein
MSMTTSGAGSSGSDSTSTTNDNIPLSCGNGIIEGGESCDDGNDLNADSYNGAHQRCTSSCELAVCGDGHVLWPSGDDPGEACDAGDDNKGEYGGCTADCEFAPFCGDGERQPEHEFCDCGEPAEPVEPGEPGGDVCFFQQEDDVTVPCEFNTCQVAAKLVFLADPEGSAPGWIGAFSFAGLAGIEAADWLCDALAVDAGLIPTAPEQLEQPRFRAWLSTLTSPVKTHFTTYENHWYLQRTGVLVAESWSDLLENGPASSIVVTQDGESITGVRVWSNTTVDGSVANDNLDCGGWTQGVVNFMGMLGYNGDSDDPASWTVDPGISEIFCNSPFRLYCFEQ